eukprot:GFYU01011471.1.p1 GENE.GFYU01011471.1~~GFYU01011471.1.p1  ORF type:complete len:473 (+),score=184.82 GFYU01011471.1:47-1465(+)
MSAPVSRATGQGFEFICWALENPAVAALIPLPISLVLSLWVSGCTWAAIFWYPLCVVAPIVTFIAALVIGSYMHDGGEADWEKFIEVHDQALYNSYKGKKIPIDMVVEAYMVGKIDLKKDFMEILMHRNQLFRFCFTWNHLTFFVATFLKQLTGHSSIDDHKEVGDVYNRGNDFYSWFLGDTMIYTSGIFQSPSESLETAQYRKLDTIAKFVHMKEGDEHLDIGCGWGTLISYMAKNYKSKSTGCTLAKEQVDWGKKVASEKYGVADKVNFLCCDYREIPKQSNNKKWDKITCLEMAEHVGIKNFQNFLLQVGDMLKDDGTFYLQIAGLRRSWQWEDLVWGLFMGKYIFPGADASCPLGFVVNGLERAGFEVHRVENTGVHYSVTIQKWYENWLSNEEAIKNKYGKWWFRLWVVFLGWSVMIARQGSSTVFMITCTKNVKNDASSVADPVLDKAPLDRYHTFIGQKPIATQQ